MRAAAVQRDVWEPTDGMNGIGKPCTAARGQDQIADAIGRRR